MLLHQKVTNFNAYLTYKRLKVLFFAQKNKTNVHESMQNSRLNTFEHQSLRILRFHSQANIIMVFFN